MGIKIAHIAVVSPKRCGLYETTRELVVGLRGLNTDSRIYDPTREKNKLFPLGQMCDRDAPISTPFEFVKDADILVNHSGLGEAVEALDKPIIHVAHGRPRSSFLTEVQGSTPIYSYHYHKSKDARFRAVVTFWPEHAPYLQVMWPNTSIDVVQAPVDLKTWTPEGPSGYKFHGAAGRLNVVCTDAWRIDVDPFEVVNAYALAARKIPDVKLHIYGGSATLAGWAPLLKQIQDDGNLGEVRGWVDGLANVYRAADALITPHCIAVRSIREAMACGCPVIKLLGSYSISKFVDDFENAFGENGWASKSRQTHRDIIRQRAEKLFDPNQTARQFLEVAERVANGSR